MLYLWLTLLLLPLLRLRAGRAAGTPRKVLLVQTAKIGDFVCTTPLIRELRRGWPGAELHLLIDPVNEPLVRHNPYGLRVHLLPDGKLRGIQGRRWLYRLLREQAIDTTICVSPSLTLWLAPLWAGVARRASLLPNYGGSSYRLARAFLTHAEAHVAGRLVLDSEFALLRQLGLDPQDRHKEAWAAPDAKMAAELALGGREGPLIGIGVSSGNKLKELGEDKLLQLARGLLQRSSAGLVLVGGPGDRELSQALRRQLAAEGYADRIVDTSGRLDLTRLPALLARFDVYVGVDSGVTYLADAMDVPVVDLMGPADADDQRPTGPNALVLRTDLPCAPCSHAFRATYHCAIGTRACVEGISATEIAQAAWALLQREKGGAP